MNGIRSRCRRALSALFVLSATLPVFCNGAAAQTAVSTPSGRGILTFQFANDLFGNTDQHFTHGTRLAWMAPEDHVPGWVKEAASYVPLFDVAASKRIVYSLGQNIYTPDDISQTALLADDRP